MMREDKSSLILNRLIFFFMAVFLLTLTNSIFLNQLGYYGALLLLLAKFVINKKNPFVKTGLEFAFLWFILAEILSAIFSEYQSAAFNNVLKRALLIPIVYTTIAAATDIKKGKIFFKIYIGASLITVLIYLYFAYQHYLKNLYGITESGPSIFQYPITASEIISVTVVFLFAFLINEKVSVKNRMFLLAGFGLSLLALLSTYKRTGWIGAAMGIFIILIAKKEWRIIVPLAIAGGVLLFVQEDVSKVHVYNYDDGKINEEFSISTEGKAYSVAIDSSFLYVSDYENGILKYSDSTKITTYPTPSPIVKFEHWKDEYFYAHLIDTRFLLMKKRNELLQIDTVFLTKGLTSSMAVFNGYLYILDSDSGLTVYRDPALLQNYMLYDTLHGYQRMYVDQNHFVFVSLPNKIDIFINEYNLPGQKIAEYVHPNNLASEKLSGGKLLAADNNKVSLFEISDSSLILRSANESLKQLFKWEETSGKLLGASLDGSLYQLEFPIKDSLRIISKNDLGFTPQSIEYSDGKLYASELKVSRLASIWDPYHPSNASRLALWRAGIEMFKDHPAFGVGDIDLREYYTQYKREFDKEILGHMHNNFMHVLVTLGAFGFLAVIFLFIKIIGINIRIYKKLKDEPFLSSYALGALGAFFAFLFAGLTELNFGDHEIITLVWFIIGLNIAFYHRKNIMEDRDKN